MSKNGQGENIGEASDVDCPDDCRPPTCKSGAHPKSWNGGSDLSGVVNFKGGVCTEWCSPLQTGVFGNVRYCGPTVAKNDPKTYSGPGGIDCRNCVKVKWHAVVDGDGEGGGSSGDDNPSVGDDDSDASKGGAMVCQRAGKRQENKCNKFKKAGPCERMRTVGFREQACVWQKERQKCVVEQCALAKESEDACSRVKHLKGHKGESLPLCRFKGPKDGAKPPGHCVLNECWHLPTKERCLHMRNAEGRAQCWFDEERLALVKDGPPGSHHGVCVPDRCASLRSNESACLNTTDSKGYGTCTFQEKEKVCYPEPCRAFGTNKTNCEAAKDLKHGPQCIFYAVTK